MLAIKKEKMRDKTLKVLLLSIMTMNCINLNAQTIQYTMPEETQEHEGTWIQWPHNYLYGPWYKDDVTPTFISMTNALQSGENVHIIAYDSTELAEIITALSNESVPLTNIDFFIYQTDDVWSRDNGPMFVYDDSNNLTILDWGFNGWGFDAPYSNCDIIPQSVSIDIGIPRIDLGGMVLEGGAIEHDGNGTMMATRSSITHSSRNPTLTEAQIEDTLTTYMGISKFIWLDGVYGQEITDMHIDGFVKFANDSTIVTMNGADLDYWSASSSDIDLIQNASNANGFPYQIVIVPLTQNNVITTYGDNLAYKGSYCNYYIGNNVVLVPTYNDPNDASAISIIQGIYPNRTVVGVDVRNLYAYGGMIHCITQQQPVEKNSTGLFDQNKIPFIHLQNSPNPFSDFTTIEFKVDNNFSATLDIYNELGQMVKTLTLNSKEQKVVLSADNFKSGIYFYTLKVNGKVLGSNKMIINK